jgi:eukaryotic-like serine/threonine-protein kinase
VAEQGAEWAVATSRERADQSRCGQPPTAAARLGTVLGGKWELRTLLGTGAMASVYLGVHRNGSRVAIKLLDAQLARHGDLLQRFLREGHLANRVEHPGIVRVFDDGVSPDGAPFLVMELLEGESLSDLLAHHGPLSPAQAGLFGAQILDALGAAHERGIVHRDIKPANLFVSLGGNVKVLDFGIARLQEPAGSRPLTLEGAVLGTPSFMPPEQALGAWDRIDAQTDLWALGATLYALLTGQSVREDAADAREALLFAMWKPVRPIAAVRPELPAALANVIDRALRLDKGARWPSARAMKEALDDAVGGRVTSRAGGMTARLRTFVMPRRVAEAPQPRAAAGSRLPKFSGPRPLPLPAGAATKAVTAPVLGSSTGGRTSEPQSERSSRSVVATVSGAVTVVAVLGLTGWLVALAAPEERPATFELQEGSLPRNEVELPADGAGPTSLGSEPFLAIGEGEPTAERAPPPARKAAPKGAPRDAPRLDPLDRGRF